MEINKVSSAKQPAFNKLLPSTMPDRFSLVDKLVNNQALKKAYQEVYNAQFKNPHDIYTNINSHNKLFFKVGDKIFKPHIFKSEIGALYDAQREADKLNNSTKFIEFKV